MAASTVYIRFGETATLAWNLHGSGMKEFWVRNDFWKSTIFHITKYNQMKIPSRTLRSRIVFTGHIASTGTGLFSFMINDADDHDFGQYSCYKGSPQRPGAKVPNCGQNLVVIRVQEPYIESPGKATVGDSVNLTCHSFLKSYPNWNLTMSFIWSSNGTRLEHDGKHKLESGSRTWSGARFMTSTLTISGVTKKDRGERYTCQTVVGENLLTEQSIDNVLGVSYIPDPHSKNTEAQVGDNLLFSMKTSLRKTKIYVIGPTDRLVFEMDSTEIYIREAYWTRIKVMKVITSLATVAVQFQLSDITSSDAGRYYCSLKPRGLTGCSWDHFLVVSNAAVTVPASQSVRTPTTDDTVTVPASQSEESSTKGYLTSTSTVRDDLTTVEPTTVKASSVPADDAANTTSATNNSTTFGMSTSPSDGLTPSTASKLATTTKASEKGGLENLIVVSIGFSVATMFIISVIGVLICRRTFKRRRGDWNTRSSSSPAPALAPTMADNRIYFEIEDVWESQAGAIQRREEGTNLRRDYTNSCGYHELRHLRLKKDSVLRMTGIDMDDCSSMKSVSTVNQYDEPWI
ncbi:uncharacterized protein LOC124274054 isoform X3 [Haliotis rubra]|uniref:uncharacterized protein LOC124274054 isoform X3 n=1 Tax=Haliotis rubra TaxID=36100 RepID=UPI001EE5000A|nr:uncharacterized protein LOC124274054 isoform X3 [Haliotis rubra]